jgi:hypothetical protein
MRNLLLAAAGRKTGVIDKTPFINQLSSTAGLSLLGGVEVYAPANQFDSPGDGKRYDFSSSLAGKKVKRIKASFRYTANTSALSAFNFVVAESGKALVLALGVYDEWNAQTGFRLVDDSNNRTLRTSNWNDFLEVTFDTPVKIEDIYVKIGGRSGLTYAPIYVKDFEIEFV